MEKYLFLALTLSAAVGFGYGLFRFFRNKSALYIKMIVFGIGCAMLGPCRYAVYIMQTAYLHYPKMLFGWGQNALLRLEECASSHPKVRSDKRLYDFFPVIASHRVCPPVS
jgi:hypothetical protein